MNRQGDGPAVPDWWSELYNEDQEDAGRSAAGDSIDDRFDSAARAVDTSSTSSRTPRQWPAEPRADTAPADPIPPPTRPADGAPPEDAPVVPADTGPADAESVDVRDAESVDDVSRRGGSAGDTLVGDTPLGHHGGSAPADAVPHDAVPMDAAPTAGSPDADFPDADFPDVDSADPESSERVSSRWRRYVGDRPPTYEPEPTTPPPADPERLDELTPDTVLDGARHGELTVRAVSMRGDSGRYRGRPRGDALLAAKFGTGDSALLLLALASGSRTIDSSHLAAQELCTWIGEAIGHSQARLAEDLRLERRSALKSGLGRLTARGLGRLRASAVERDLDPLDYGAGLRCLLLPADPHCRVRLFFGAGGGGLFRLRAGEWRDLEPAVPAQGPVGDETWGGPGSAAPRTPPFLFRTSLAEAGDALLLCTAGMADPVRAESELRAELAQRWGTEQAPGLADFLVDTQLRVTGHAGDRSAVGVWEAPRRRR